MVNTVGRYSHHVWEYPVFQLAEVIDPPLWAAPDQPSNWHAQTDKPWSGLAPVGRQSSQLVYGFDMAGAAAEVGRLEVAT